MAVLIVVCIAAVGGLAYWIVQESNRPHAKQVSENRKLRVAAIEARSAEIIQSTDGAISIERFDDRTYRDGHMSVRVNISGCQANGYFELPEAPASSAKVSDLYIELPSIERMTPNAVVKISDPSFYDMVMRSNLADCAVNDWRLQK